METWVSFRKNISKFSLEMSGGEKEVRPRPYFTGLKSLRCPMLGQICTRPVPHITVLSRQIRFEKTLETARTTTVRSMFICLHFVLPTKLNPLHYCQ